VRFLFFWRLSRVPLAASLGAALAGRAGDRDADYLAALERPPFFGTGHLLGRRIQSSLLTDDLAAPMNRLYEGSMDASPEVGRPLRAAMLFDQATRLPDDVLMRTDRASMFFSLETRVPYLGPEVVDWANRLEDRLCVRLRTRLRGSDMKRPLKRLAARLVPPDVVYREKRGFDLPLREWLLSDPHFAAEDLLVEQAVPGLRYETCRTLLEGLRSNQGRLAGPVWAWLTLEHWYRRYALGQATPTCPDWTKRLGRYDLLRAAGEA
jgi:asparagine synthetase B (glutamine-hydrolysing)